jgi:hypothetical protein
MCICSFPYALATCFAWLQVFVRFKETLAYIPVQAVCSSWHSESAVGGSAVARLVGVRG